MGEHQESGKASTKPVGQSNWASDSRSSLGSVLLLADPGTHIRIPAGSSHGNYLSSAKCGAGSRIRRLECPGGWAEADDIEALKKLTLEINDHLVDLFLKADLILVDFKLEFGKNSGKIYLGDEFTPDGCRVWDKETKKKLDKDRFRLGLGDVVESYQEIAHRLGVNLT